MVSSINTSGISVDNNGKVTLSGFASSVDSKAIIDATITAKRIPAVKLEAKITKNQSAIAALGDLKSLVSTLRTSMDQLRGSNSFLSDNVFKSKLASGTTAAASGAPGTHVPSDITALVSVAVQDTAQVGTHTLNITQIAKANQIRSDAFTAKDTALTGLGVTAGDILVNGVTVTIDSDDSLIDLRGKINASNAGVTATIVSADATTHYLVLTSTETGQDFAIDLDVGSTTSDDLGLTTNLPSAGTIKNELVVAQNAIFSVDGITGIERASNDVDDVIEGMTISLLKGEADTDITLKIEPDLISIKTAVSDFVTAYNDIRAFYTDQRTTSDRNEDGVIDDAEFGVLATDTTLRQIVDRLGQVAAGQVSNNTDGYRSLSQVGITVNSDYQLELDDSVFDSKLITDVDSFRTLFGFDFTSSDSRLASLGRTANTQSGTYYLSLSGTDVDGNLLSANLTTVAATGTGGADDGSLVVSGKQGTASDQTNANGLLLFFNGTPSLGAVNDIQVTVSRGVIDSFFDYFDELVTVSGSLDTRINNLTSDNLNYQEDIDLIDTRLETTRTTLELKYVRMETALAKLESLRNTLSSYFDTQNSSS